jgi:DNA-binding CsgD family transcriptional regulator
MEELLERDREWAAIDRRLTALQGGEGATLLLAGEAGIGKTALLLGARARAERLTMRVLRASGAALEREFGFGVVRQLLEREVRALGSVDRERVFSGAASAAAGVFGLPTREYAPAPDTDSAFLVRHALVWVLEALAEPGPLVLLVDDLQWVDGASLRWLAHLGRRLEAMPVLLVAALRTGEEPAAPEEVAELELVVDERLLRPAPLSAEAVGVLTEGALGTGDPDFARRCHHATAGNPLLVWELLRAASEEGLAPTRESAARLEGLAAQRLGDRVIRRLTRLHAPARKLAGAVAVLEAAELRVAAALAGLSAEDAALAADELHAAGILGGERPLRFVHPLLRAAVEVDLPPAARASAHRRAAVLLDADPARADEAVVHLLRADPAGDPWAVERLRAAAGRALERGAPDASVTMLERALAEPAGEARGEVLAELARAERRVGRPAEAVEHFAQAQALVPAAEREALARQRALTLVERDLSEEAAGVLEAAIADLEGPESSVREARLRLEADFATVAFGSNTLTARGLERIERVAVGLHGTTAAERAVLASAEYGRYWTVSEDAESFAAAIEELLASSDLLEDLTPGSLTRIQLVLAVFHADRVELALSLLDELITRERQRGDVPLLVGYLNARSRILAYLGRLAEAEAVARQGLELHSAAVHVWGHPSLVAALITPMVAAGRVGEAEVALEQLAPAGSIGPVGTFHIARMELWSVQGRHELAVANAEELLARLDARAHAGIRLREVAAATFLAAGDRTRAIEVAQRGLEVSRRWGARSTIAPNLRVLGQASGDEAALSEAVALLDGGPFRLEWARCLLALGAHLRRTRRRTDAREPLRAALDLAHRCGAQPLVDAATTELRACGARPRTVALTGIDSLTVSERRVAQLVAAGNSNPQVAQALFITRSTVEAHLRSIFRKLDLSSREQLGPLLEDESSLSLIDAKPEGSP